MLKHVEVFFHKMENYEQNGIIPTVVEEAANTVTFFSCD